MKNRIRAALALVLGAGTFLIGQSAVEVVAWWWAGDTATFADPFVNAIRIALSASAGLAVAAMVGIPPARRRRLL